MLNRPIRDYRMQFGALLAVVTFILLATILSGCGTYEEDPYSDNYKDYGSLYTVRQDGVTCMLFVGSGKAAIDCDF